MDSVGEAAAGALAALVAGRWQASARRHDGRTPGPAPLLRADLDLDLVGDYVPASRARDDDGDRTEPPAPRLIRTPRDAEQAAAAYMRWLGYDDARVTPDGADGGLDVTSSEAVAQVKMEGVRTSRPTVQALHGVAQADGKRGLFFSLGGYSREAVEWANQPRVRLPLWQFDLQGTPQATNAPALELIASAGSTAERPDRAAVEGATSAARLRDDQAERAYAELVAAVTAQRAREQQAQRGQDPAPTRTVSSSSRVVVPPRRTDPGRQATAAPDPSPTSVAQEHVPGEEYQPSLDAPVLVWLARLSQADWTACQRQATHAAQAVRDALTDLTSDENRALRDVTRSWTPARLLAEVEAVSPPSTDLPALSDDALREEYVWLFAERRYRAVYEHELELAVVLAGVRRCAARATADPPSWHAGSGCDHAAPAYRREDAEALAVELRERYKELLWGLM